MTLRNMRDDVGKKCGKKMVRAVFGLTSPVIPRYSRYHRLIDLPLCFWRNRTHLDSLGTGIIATSTSTLVPASDINGQLELEHLYDITTASRTLQAGPSRHHLHRAALDEFTLCEPAARRPLFVTWGRAARRIAEIAAMHTRTSDHEPTAQNVVGVSE
jgi:hypothetical protein